MIAPDGKKPTILIADSQALSRCGLRMLLERAGYVIVGEAGDGAEAADLADQLQPDVFVIDLDLDLLPGLEAVRKVRRLSPKTAVMVLTQVEACASVVGAIRAGAMGYCLRSAEPDEFLRALEAVCHGDMYICPRLAKFLVPGRCVGLDAQDCQGLSCLTDRELQIVKLVAEGHSSPDIAALLELSSATVDRHRANLMQKLGVHSVPHLVLFAARSGLVDLNRNSA